MPAATPTRPHPGLTPGGRSDRAPAMAKDPKDTPMMRQYLEAKTAQPGAVVLMRMGDFYEAFFEDAQELSRVCGVALTSRNKDGPDPVPMAGVPHHSLKTHLPKLLAAGKRVAVVDQLEDPAQAKGLVRRGLTRVITAGTLIDEDALDGVVANWLVALTALDPEDGRPIGIAALDVSTGRFQVEDASTGQALALALARLAPAELVLPDVLRQADGTRERLAAMLAPAALPPLAGLAAFAWKPADARRWLGERLAVAALDGFGIGRGDDHLAAAAAACLRYAESSLSGAAVAEGGTGKGLGHVRSLVRLHAGEHLVLDASCRRNLDLVRNRDNQREGTLLAAIDRTRTAPGARLLADWLVRPLAQAAPIRARHDAVERLLDDPVRAAVRTALANVYDLERLLARIATGRAHARDLVHLGNSLAAAATVASALPSDGLPALLAEATTRLHPADDLTAEIHRVLVDDPPLAIGEGGLVRDGIDRELDEFRVLQRDAGAWLAEYEKTEAAAIGLPRLKVGCNSVFGYYIELTRAQAERVPAHWVRKQTLVNAERYITPSLKEYEDRALHADERARAKELTIFHDLRARCEDRLVAIQLCAQALALIDVSAAFAEVARSEGWCRPVIDDSTALSITAGRHPVVERVVGRSRFVANDTNLDATVVASTNAEAETQAQSPGRLAMITGPNMAGKSTYIRQVALIAVLAQAGAFVPAAQARLGLIDRIFTRVGAGDELARGQSTFMVEMAETAAILNHASARSLVILDEVGRGTSTFDGVSLAWAITEHLHDRIRCRTLFATHYHELTDLAADRSGIRNLTVEVAEQDDDVAFLHRIVPGAATKSYGIHVARLAGVPRRVLARAREVLATLETLNVGLTEQERPQARAGNAPVQLTLFAPVPSPALDRLKATDLDQLSPRQAHDLLYELQAIARRE